MGVGIQRVQQQAHTAHGRFGGAGVAADPLAQMDQPQVPLGHRGVRLQQVEQLGQVEAGALKHQCSVRFCRVWPGGPWSSVDSSMNMGMALSNAVPSSATQR